MKILITGAKGMLGRTLVRRWSGKHEIIATDREELDICDAAACTAAIASLRPETVVHCAAHTAVDRCETDVDAAFRLNAVGSANVAAACHRGGARLMAISTDYVFAGDLSRPYHEWDDPAPRTIYGQTKLAGERAIQKHCPDHVIARIAWLYGPGGPSFIHTMLKLGQQGGSALRVVNDQVGNPTSTDAVATTLEPLLARGGPVGTFHATCSGRATWYDLTRTLFERTGITRVVDPCTTAEYPRPAPRPANSQLEPMALRLHGLPTPCPWQEALDGFLRNFPSG